MDSKEEIVKYNESLSERVVSHAKRNPFLMAGIYNLLSDKQQFLTIYHNESF